GDGADDLRLTVCRIAAMTHFVEKFLVVDEGAGIIRWLVPHLGSEELRESFSLGNTTALDGLEAVLAVGCAHVLASAKRKLVDERGIDEVSGQIGMSAGTARAEGVRRAF